MLHLQCRNLTLIYFWVLSLLILIVLSVFGFRPQEASVPVKEERKKPRPKDVFGRTLPTEEEFAVLKNAPRYNFNYHIPSRPMPFSGST